MENTSSIKRLIKEVLHSLGEGTNHTNEVSLEDMQNKPEIGKPGEANLEDHIRALKEERDILVRKLQNTQSQF